MNSPTGRSVNLAVPYPSLIHYDCDISPRFARSYCFLRIKIQTLTVSHSNVTVEFRASLDCANEYEQTRLRQFQSI